MAVKITGQSQGITKETQTDLELFSEFLARFLEELNEALQNEGEENLMSIHQLNEQHKERLHRLHQYAIKLKCMRERGGDVFFRGLQRAFNPHPVVGMVNYNDGSLPANGAVTDQNINLKEPLVRLQYANGGGNFNYKI